MPADDAREVTPTAIGPITSREGRAILESLKKVTDRVNEIDRRVAEELGSMSAELSRNTDAVRELKASGTSFRRELDSQGEFAEDTAERAVKDLELRLKEQQLSAFEREKEADRLRKKARVDVLITGIIVAFAGCGITELMHHIH